jgi:uncharacterized protein (DUF1697 family)
MSARAVLLRGVNVGGAGKLPMAEFRAMLEGLRLARVRSYIQSGNAVFDSDLSPADLEPLIRDAIAARFGFAPDTFVLTVAKIAAALTDHPFADADPARVHVFFLRETPAPEDAALRALALPSDSWHIGPRRFTLHTPDGIGRSKLAERLLKHLPSPMTARNLRTVAAVHAMLADLAHP